jgi:hypothetical protein
LTIRRRLADRVWQWRRLTYAASTALVVLTIIGVFVSISLPSANVEPATGPTFFDSGRAYAAITDFVGLYPDPQMGTPDAAGAAAWYKERLDALKIPYTEREFEAPLGWTHATIRSIAVKLSGTSRDTILVTGSRDPSMQTKLPPLANGSATGMLLELIQVFADTARPHDKTMIFLSSEGGSYGGLGVDDFLDNSPDTGNIKAMLSLEGLGREQVQSLVAGVNGPRGTTPGWYVQLAGNILSKAEINLQLPGLQTQIGDQALQLSLGEQVAGLRHDISSLLIADTSGETVTAAGLATQGTAIERLIMSLDQGGQIPSDPGTALVLESGRYLTKRAIAILGVLMLFPAFIMAFTWLAVTRLRPDAWMRHLRNALSFFLPLAFLIGLIPLERAVGLLPRYLWQAPSFASPATEAQLLPALVLAVLFLVAFPLVRHFLGYLRPREPRAMTEIAKLSLGLMILFVGLAMLAAQSPFALLVWLSAAWIWPLVSCFRDTSHRAITLLPRFRSNLPLLLTGLVTPVAFYLYLALTTSVNFWSGWWFLLVQTASGAFGITAPLAWALLGTAFLLLMGVRRLQVLPIETLEDRDDLSYVEASPPRVRKVKLRNTP